MTPSYKPPHAAGDHVSIGAAIWQIAGWEGQRGPCGAYTLATWCHLLGRAESRPAEPGLLVVDHGTVAERGRS